MPLVVIGASLLQCFAVRMLSNGDAAPNGETKHGNEQTTKDLHGRAFMAMALSNNASVAACPLISLMWMSVEVPQSGRRAS
jgi:hypothetical protein